VVTVVYCFNVQYNWIAGEKKRNTTREKCKSSKSGETSVEGDEVAEITKVMMRNDFSAIRSIAPVSISSESTPAQEFFRCGRFRALSSIVISTIYCIIHRKL